MFKDTNKSIEAAIASCKTFMDINGIEKAESRALMQTLHEVARSVNSGTTGVQHVKSLMKCREDIEKALDADVSADVMQAVKDLKKSVAAVECWLLMEKWGWQYERTAKKPVAPAGCTADDITVEFMAEAMRQMLARE